MPFLDECLPDRSPCFEPCFDCLGVSTAGEPRRWLYPEACYRAELCVRGLAVLSGCCSFSCLSLLEESCAGVFCFDLDLLGAGYSFLGESSAGTFWLRLEPEVCFLSVLILESAFFSDLCDFMVEFACCISFCCSSYPGVLPCLDPDSLLLPLSDPFLPLSVRLAAAGESPCLELCSLEFASLTALPPLDPFDDRRPEC